MNSEDAYKTAWIHTRFGRFDLDAPLFDIRDIAHALSQLARYNGHTSQFYTVAAHSCLVCYLMAAHVGGDPLEGLLHDGLEAYLSDVPSPFKHLLPDYKAIDNRLDMALRKSFGLPLTKTAHCKEADWLALFIEAKHLVNGEGADFADPLNLRNKALALIARDSMFDLSFEPLCIPERDARVFLNIYHRLNHLPESQRRGASFQAFQ
jgi:uncharacterized protein